MGTIDSMLSAHINHTIAHTRSRTREGLEQRHARTIIDHAPAEHRLATTAFKHKPPSAVFKSPLGRLRQENVRPEPPDVDLRTFVRGVASSMRSTRTFRSTIMPFISVVMSFISSSLCVTK